MKSLHVVGGRKERGERMKGREKKFSWVDGGKLQWNMSADGVTSGN